MTTIFINEIHYENIGFDKQEGVEVAAPAGHNFDGWSIHFYNGASGHVDGSVKLRGVVHNLQNGWGVIYFPFELKNHSSGTGLALVAPDGHVAQFLSYRAVVKASNGPASGTQAQLIPVQETIWTGEGLSLQLQGNGNKYEDFKWDGPVKQTFGSINIGQSFAPLPSPPSSSSSSSPSSPSSASLGNIELYSEVNRAKHHTAKFHGTELIILRRGEIFLIGLKGTSLDAKSVVFKLKSYPEGKAKTFGLLDKEVPVTPENENEFVAYVNNAVASITSVSIRIPGSAAVGEFLFSVSVDGGKVFTSESHLVILFNAWSNRDTVFLNNEEHRQEYVMADDGLIWVGNQYSNTPRAWNFAQFNTKSLLATLKLLQSIPLESRSNPVLVARQMSALVNVQDDNGVVIGNWSGKYDGGKPPTAWTGSEDILKQFLLTGKPVGFGQCWVFSGVLTTVMRALGIPARSVTNFASAHDVPIPNYNRSVDKYFKKGGLQVDESKTVDSVWNFHVWNDVWMARPDLGEAYFGWQAIDSTPQEESAGKYQLGPAPVAAIKEGEKKDINYDLEFVYSEVNADENYYVEKDDGSGYKLIRTITDSVGINMSTKAVGSNNRQDITSDYKYPEGSIEERASHGTSDSAKDADITLKWEVDDHAALGSVIPAKLILESKKNASSTVQVQLAVTSIQYTGRQRENVTQKQQTVTVKAGTPTTIDFSLPVQTYEKYLHGDNSFLFKAYIEVNETQQATILLREFDFRNFGLVLDYASDSLDVGSTPTVSVSFTNKLSFPLTNIFLVVDGQGLTKLQSFKFTILKPGETLKQAVILRVLEKGKHLLIAGLDCSELSGIKAHHEMIVR